MTSEPPASWRLARWGDVAELVYGKALRDRSDDGPVVVYGTNGATGRTDRTLGEGPTVVIGRKGAYRGVHYAPGSFWVIDTAFFLVPGADVDMRWAYYELLTHDINGLDSGSAIPSTRREDFYAMPVRVPPRDEQRRIVSVLDALDVKIDSNRRLRTVTDEVATEVFRAAQRQEPGEETTVARLVEERIVDIGDGFRAKNSDLAADGIPFARARNLIDGFDFAAADRVPESLARVVAAKCSSPGDVAFTSKGTVGRFAFVDRWIEQFVYSPQLCFWRSLDHARLPPVWLFRWMQGAEAKQQFDALKGQTDMADYVSLRDQRSMVVSLPRDETMRRIAATVEPLTAATGLLRAESRTLSALRNALLPKLISGQIRVPDTADPAEVIEPAVEALQAAAQ